MDRPRGLPSAPSPANRPSNEGRRPPGAPGGPPSTASSSTTPSGMSRAERFDDERRRITESCFSKTDDNGQLIESYITHIKVVEDGAYPQSPPPPSANPANKKSRLIIISVRATGRVRVHKARENANGTFSIGKTWNMEDLSGVENYAHMVPTSEEEAQRKQWAGETGFTVTIQKPYYWEASTAKEKEFFVGSMVKIFHKYTQGDFPVLSGFSPSELNSLTAGRPQLATPEARASRRNGDSAAQRPPLSSSPAAGPRSPLPPGMQTSTPPLGDGRRPPPLRDNRRPPPLSDDRRPPTGSRPTTGDEERRPPPRRPPTAEGDRERRPPPRGVVPPGRPTTGEEARRPSPLRDSPSGQGTPPLPPFLPGQDVRRPRPRPSMEQSMRSAPNQESMDMRAPPSRDQMRPVPGQATIPVPPSQRLTPQSSRSEFGGLRPETPDTGSVSSVQAVSPVQRRQAEDARSQRSFDESSFDGTGGMPGEQRRPNGNRDLSPKGLRPNTAQSNASSAFSRSDEPPTEEPVPRMGPPERRRPPMLSPQSSDSTPAFVTPAQTPPPPANFPTSRKPQGLPERPKPAFEEEATMRGGGRYEPEPTQPLQSARSPDPQPPPNTALPQIPKPAEVQASIPQDATRSAEPIPVKEEMPTSPTAEEQEEAHRRGLGPMVKMKGQKESAKAADVFRKAAFAAGAFKPRAGGAAAKLFNKEQKASDEPDGISGVFVPQRQVPKEEKKEPEPELEQKAEPDQPPHERPSVDTEVVPSVTVSSPLEPPPAASSMAPNMPSPRAPSPEMAAPKPEAEVEVRKKRRRSNQQVTNISRLGIDPTILDERGLDFEILLSECGWGSSELSGKNMESLEQDIKREIARAEAGSWLNHLEQKDDRVEAVERMLDRAIAECDELEGLLTLYNVELSSLNDDIAFIEAQSQGLQVQTANQRLLQSELKQLVDTISITPSDLEPLRRAPIGKVNGLMAIESSLLLLYKALITIDPAFIQGSRAATGDLEQITSNTSGFGNSELAEMQALQEKKDRYLNESALFLDRLKQHMTITFGAAFLQTKDALANLDKTAMPSTKSNIEAHNAGRNMLWMLSPVILFAKEIDRDSWNKMLQMYQEQAGQVYQEEIRDNILSWKRFARKPTGDEQDLLFTAQEKETESITGAARKLTVKRSQTLARGLRSTSGDKESKTDKVQAGKLYPFDVFSKALEDMGPILLTEQNFITDFFHATSSDAVDFPDAVMAAPPEERRTTDLYKRHLFESDRTMAKRVAGVMEDIFSFWPTETQNLVDWAIKADPLQGVGILYAVDHKMYDIEDSNQDFLTRTLQKIHDRLTGLFTKFVDEQIKAIEDTKVKIKKRKGVIAFMKTFPHFSVAIENMLPDPDHDTQLEIRRMVDDAYQRINKAMFESLKVIAKESPTVMGTQGQGDPEDKEALNYHILLIENMNHYIEEVDPRNDTVLLDWKAKAEEDYREHMGLYVDAVIRRPLGKLLEFIESTETLMAVPGTNAQSIASRSSHSRSLFKKIINANDAKEIRKGIEALKKRVDKHFGDADDPSISRDLVFKVLKECEGMYLDVFDRATRINQDVYSGEVEIDWGRNEIGAAFRR